MLKCSLLIALLLGISASAQVFNSKFDSKNHPKAKGDWVTVRYPTGWEAKEGERPNIVQKFSGDYKDMYVVLALQILDAGGDVEKECKDMSVSSFADAFSDKANNQFVINVTKTKHEEKTAFMYVMQSTLQRAGISTTLNNKVMTLCHKNTLISVWCSPTRFNRAQNQIVSTQRELDEVNPICFSFFNSLVLMDKY